MSFIFGSCPGPADAWLQLSDAIVAAATGRSLKTVGISSGGTGYVVGDFLSIAGGTSTVTAQVEVTSVAAGVIDGVRIYNAGVYTSAASSPNSATGGTGSGASLTFTEDLNGWTEHRNSAHELTTVDSVAAGGTGYVVNDIITLTGGVGTAATLTVASLSGSAVATVTITTVGDYTVLPTDPVAQGSTDGVGTGATFNLTFADGEREVILEGEGSGSDEIFVGWRTYSDVPSGRYNLELHGMSGYSALVALTEQPSVSPGFWDGGSSAAEAGSYLVATNASCNYWLSVLPGRIAIFCQVGGDVFNGYLGWGDRYATAAEYPYPLISCGSTSDADAHHAQTIQMSGLCDPWRYNGAAYGPMNVMFVDNAWYGVQNSNISTGNAGSATGGERVVLPCGVPDIADSSVAAADKFASFGNGIFTDFIPNAGVVTATGSMQKTPGTADAIVMLPATIVFVQPSHQVLMELTGIFWVSGFGGIQANDRTVVNGVVYRLFPNCNRSAVHGFVAVKEE